MAITPEAEEIADDILSAGAIPASSTQDALHVGITTAQGTDYLLTWNFKHINNVYRKAHIVKAIEPLGYACPEICSPEELDA